MTILCRGQSTYLMLLVNVLQSGITALLSRFISQSGLQNVMRVFCLSGLHRGIDLSSFPIKFDYVSQSSTARIVIHGDVRFKTVAETLNSNDEGL